MSKRIAIIKDEDIGLKSKDMIQPVKRYAARGMVFDGDKLAVFHKKHKCEYKLPGGGIEEGEKPIDAFKREVLEETGCDIDHIHFLGMIEEHKSLNHFIQESYVYVAHVTKNHQHLNLTEKEKNEGGSLIWMTIDEALMHMRDSFNHLKPSQYENVYMTHFIVKRDIKILEYYMDKKNKLLED